MKNKEKKCTHCFRYSHVEYEQVYPGSTMTRLPESCDVVICEKCGLLIKTLRK
jgi:hypothetical protein